MKRLPFILLCIPLLCFSQDKSIKNSKFNFKKSNNYSKNSKKTIKDNSRVTIFDSTKITKQSDSRFIKKNHNVLPYPLNKGLIYMLTETLKKERASQKFTIKKKEKMEK